MTTKAAQDLRDRAERQRDYYKSHGWKWTGLQVRGGGERRAAARGVRDGVLRYTIETATRVEVAPL